jgi:hypothetical protein
MPDAYTTGSWEPFPGQEKRSSTRGPSSRAGRLSFPFLEWRASHVISASRTGSSASWTGRPSRLCAGGRVHPEFKERMSRVQKHIDKFAPTELELVASCMSGGAVSTENAR